jgi:hypothetical protein
MCRCPYPTDCWGEYSRYSKDVSASTVCCAIRSIVGMFVKVGCIRVRFAARTGRDIVLADARGDPRFNLKLDHDLACGSTTSLMYVFVYLCLSLLPALGVPSFSLSKLGA